MRTKRKHFKLINITPSKFMCLVGPACSAVYFLELEGQDKLAIVGKKADPKELGIADRVGKDEQVIIVDRGMIEGLFEKQSSQKLKRQKSSEDTG